MFPNRSKTFRWTLTAAAALAIAGAAGFVSVYRSAESLLDTQVRADIADEIQRLEEIHDLRGEDRLRRAVAERIALYRGRPEFYELADSAGTLSSAPTTPPLRELTPGWRDFTVTPSEDAKAVQVLAQIAVLSDGTRLAVGRLRHDRALLHRVVGVTAGAATATILLVALVASWLVSRSVRLRLERVADATGAIVAGQFRGRLPPSSGNDEFDRLGENINAMLDAIENLVASQHAATTAIAHDLRTPLTRLRSRLETAQRSTADANELRDAIHKGIADADSIVAAFNALLRIAKLEAETGQPTACDIAPVVENVCELYAPLADEAGIVLALDLATEARALAEPALLAQALANILDNAVKYTPSGGAITVTLRTGTWVEIAVADNGPGIPAPDHARVRRPFVRLDASRNAPGSGLGLSVVVAIAEHQGGEFILADAAPGLVATLRLRPAT